MSFFRFRYATALQNAFSGGGIVNLQNLDNQSRHSIIFPQNHELSLVLTAISGWVPSNKANVFVADHDTERVSFFCITWFAVSVLMMIIQNRVTAR
jgi:hypothetical protein